MEETNQFFIDLLAVLPDEIDCYYYAPSLDNTFILENSENLSPTESVLRLNKTLKNKIIEIEKATNFSFHINEIIIKQLDKKLFIGYDGIEYGTLSKNLNVPDWFYKIYRQNLLVID